MVYLDFQDLEKTYYSVDGDALSVALEIIDCREKILTDVRSLYEQSSACAGMAGNGENTVLILRCGMSPWL